MMGVDTQIIKGGYLITGISKKLGYTWQIQLTIVYYSWYSAFYDSGNQLRIEMGSYGNIEVTGVKTGTKEIKILYAQQIV